MNEVVLKVSNLSFSYPNSPLILDSISFEVREGEFVGIMGPSPSGKSTLAYALTGLIPHYVEGDMKGEVVVAGLNTREHSIAELSKHIGIVFQDPEAQLLELRVIDEVALPLENLGIPRNEIEKRVWEAMKVVGVEKYADKNPMELSGGEKQKVAIASVLALKPKILVLDEPTANIDVKGTYQVYETLKKLNKELGLTVIVIENKTEFIAKYTSRVILMKNGRIVADGPTSEVVKNSQLLMSLDIDPLDDPVSVNSLHECGRGEEDNTVILVDNVHYRYPDGTHALRGVTLEIKQGETVFLMGENGSGKSTLARHLNGLLKPTKGRVIVEGKDTRQAKTCELAKKVGLVFQNPSHQIVGDTVYDEIAIGLRSLGYSEEHVEKEVKRIAKIFGLEEKLDLIPEELSVGELKRLMVASVVAMKPKVIVLDEPMTGLTRMHSKRVLKAIRRVLGEECTMVVITHDPVLAVEFADKIVLMKEGKIILESTPERALREAVFTDFVKEVCAYA